MRELRITSQELAIKHFIALMDIEMISDILDDDKTYQDMEKPLFISKLGLVFEKFYASGDTYLMPYTGKCGRCVKNKGGFIFVGNKSKNYFTLIFDVHDGKINDLYECAIFENEVSRANLNEEFCIDDYDYSEGDIF